MQIPKVVREFILRAIKDDPKPSVRPKPLPISRRAAITVVIKHLENNGVTNPLLAIKQEWDGGLKTDIFNSGDACPQHRMVSHLRCLRFFLENGDQASITVYYGHWESLYEGVRRGWEPLPGTGELQQFKGVVRYFRGDEEIAQTYKLRNGTLVFSDLEEDVEIA